MLQSKDIGQLNGWENMTHVYVVYKRHTWDKRFKEAESKGIEENIPCKCKQKNYGVAVLISDKIDLKAKAITKDKEGHYIILKGLIQ